MPMTFYVRQLRSYYHFMSWNGRMTQKAIMLLDLIMHLLLFLWLELTRLSCSSLSSLQVLLITIWESMILLQIKAFIGCIWVSNISFNFFIEFTSSVHISDYPPYWTRLCFKFFFTSFCFHFAIHCFISFEHVYSSTTSGATLYIKIDTGILFLKMMESAEVHETLPTLSVDVKEFLPWVQGCSNVQCSILLRVMTREALKSK